MTFNPPASISTFNNIVTKVRRLTVSPSEQSLPTQIIYDAIEIFYNQDFPYAIKLDQMRDVYTFYTQKNVSRYPLNINYNMGIRSPVYFEGIQGYYFKSRDEFYKMWPRWPSQSTQAPQTLTGAIIAATQANPCQITSNNHGLTTGDVILIQNVNGMIQLNGNTYTIIVVDPNNFQLQGINSTGFTAYTNGGTWIANSGTFSFTISYTPLLQYEVCLGGVDQNGNNIAISDDGMGNLIYNVPNPTVYVPSEFTNVPGMKNLNTGNPGDQVQTKIGTVDYITGAISFELPGGISLAIGQSLNVWVSQYTPGRPYTLLFWNNYFEVRPVPDNTYKVEVETYLSPVQFLSSTDNPIILQWWQYISYGVAMEILRERQDFDGVETLREGFNRQEALVLERQGIEEIGQRNSTIFSGTMQQQGWNQGIGWPY